MGLCLVELNRREHVCDLASRKVSVHTLPTLGNGATVGSRKLKTENEAKIKVAFVGSCVTD